MFSEPTCRLEVFLFQCLIQWHHLGSLKRGGKSAATADQGPLPLEPVVRHLLSSPPRWVWKALF